jgi:hypothetical protein
MKEDVAMGIYVGQLPPAEIARLKAELAEMLIANFCYPRFFDARTQTLRMRPVDRAKRQEVWMYLSSVDFSQWSRIDLMSPDMQHQVERLFIQFVQRNRSFFGEQGRRRMSDIRMLIGSSAVSVVQGLRNHVTGQRQGNQPPFGTPRPVMSWSATATNGRTELSWEQIASTTMMLQQQLQELRGEVKPQLPNDGRSASASGPARRTPTRPQSAGGTTLSGVERDGMAAQTPPAQQGSAPNTRTAPLGPRRMPSQPLPGVKGTPSQSLPPVAAAPASAAPTRQAGPAEVPVVAPLPAKSLAGTNGHTASPSETASPAPVVAPTPARALSPAAQPAPSTGVVPGQRDASTKLIGDDDVAIFEQMRLQMIVWLRVEAVTAGLEIANQTPMQLLEQLRQLGRFDETRLQVVSTLLNLSNQVIKSGTVSILDYKQALLFHLMHTRR